MVYTCIFCNYTTTFRADYNRHQLTKTHNTRMRAITRNLRPNTCEECLKQYNSRVGLWKHKKICIGEVEQITMTVVDDQIESLREEINDFKSTITIALTTVIEQLKQPEAQIAGNHNVMNNHSNNHTSILMMLNTEYKDVIPLETFAKNIHVSLERTMSALNRDMPSLTRDIFLDNLAGMLPGERPIHCSDAKRETYYVKGKELWEKGGPNKLNGMICQMHCGHMNNLKTWEIAHPNWILDAVMSQEYVDTQGNLMSIVDDDDDKIKHKTIQLINEHIPIKDITHAVGNIE
jgi:hypothetical protein